MPDADDKVPTTIVDEFGKAAEQFKNCIDVDIAVTPFTNTLPIRRLQLQPNQPQQIQVIYCDILNQVIKPVSQQYIRLSNNEYHYENIPNDFEATIKVDESGFVIDYPGLFVRTAAVTGWAIYRPSSLGDNHAEYFCM